MKNNMYNLKPNFELTPIEATAVAWAIAAEGSIHLSVTTHANPKYHQTKGIQPLIEIANTKYEFLKILQDYIGGTIVARKMIWPNKPIWQLSISGIKDIYTLLKQIEPYLPIKKEQARLVMELCILRTDKTTKEGTRKRIPYQDRVWEIVAEMKQLNKRGLRP